MIYLLIKDNCHTFLDVYPIIRKYPRRLCVSK